jgi:hypothetical protein
MLFIFVKVVQAAIKYINIDPKLVWLDIAEPFDRVVKSRLKNVSAFPKS